MAEEYTIIDGETLESSFELFGGEFDRFNYIIVCDLEGVFHAAVPYIYARNITRVRESLMVISLTEYPDQANFAIRDNLLQLKSRNPAMICSLVARQDEVIPLLYQELVELQTLDLLDGSTSESISDRLIAFLKTIKAGNFDGDGVFWLPENYGGNPDIIDQEAGEDDEDYTRRIICTHIKGRRLPMVHLLHYSEEQGSMLFSLISSLEDYSGNELNKFAQQTHFAPLFRRSQNLSLLGIKTLIAEEFRCVKNEDTIDGNAPFIFTDEHITDRAFVISPEKARDNLRYYVGDYLEDLDLSRSFITGSSITASIIHTKHDYDQRELKIDILFPKIITKIADDELIEIRRENIHLWNINAISETEGVITKGENVINFSIKPGADLDIAIDNTVTDDEYRMIVQGHFNVISRYHPYVKIREYIKPKGDWNYVIYTDDPDYIPVFRTVEIYRSSFRNICSHHVGAVRGCYTSRWSEQPKFYLTASAILTSWKRATPNYHYFAGRKSNPQDIIIKNMQRGIMISDEVLDGIIHDYMRESDIVLSKFPFYQGSNVPYSIFAAPLEYTFVQEILRKQERDRIAREERITDRDRRRRAIRTQRETDTQRRNQIRDLEREEFLLANNIQQQEPRFIIPQPFASPPPAQLFAAAPPPFVQTTIPEDRNSPSLILQLQGSPYGSDVKIPGAQIGL